MRGPLCDVGDMATNLSLDPEPLEQALAVSGENPEDGRGPRPKGVYRAAHAKAVAGSDGGARLGRDIRLQGRALAPMSPFVDTSVWSLALRRDMPAACREVLALRRALENGEALITTDIDAARLRNLRRRHGVPLGTIDALPAPPCIRYDLTLRTADHDFARAAIHGPLKIWGAVPYITPRPTQGLWGPGPSIRPRPYAMPPYQARSTATGC